MKRQTRRWLEIAEHLWLVLLIVTGLSAWLASCITGCAPMPDALRAAHAANDIVVAALDKARIDLTDELEQDARERMKKCEPLPHFERRPCAEQAVMAAYDDHRLRASKLSLLVLIQRGAADALDTAAECQRAGTGCEREQVARAHEALARVRAALMPGGTR